MNATNRTMINPRWTEFWTRSTATIAIETSVLLLIGLIAIGGNLLAVISIYRNPSLRTITNYFVLSLSITDVLYSILSLPLTLAWSVQSRFIFGQKICDFQAILNTSLAWVSVNSLVLMAVNRFIRVCKPQKYKKMFSKRKALIMIAVVWITNFTSCTLYLKGGHHLVHARFIPYKITCAYVYQSSNILSKVVTNMSLVICLAMPFTIIIFCYFKVFKKIREHKRNIAPSSNPNSLGTSVQEIKVTWTVFAVLLGYLLTWIPVLLITLMSNVFRSLYIPRQVHMVVTFSGSSSCAINPIIYGVMNPAFRREYRKVIKCQREV